MLHSEKEYNKINKIIYSFKAIKSSGSTYQGPRRLKMYYVLLLFKTTYNTSTEYH